METLSENGNLAELLESLQRHPAWWKINLLARGVIWQNARNREELVTISWSGDMHCTLMTGRHPAGDEVRIQSLTEDRVLLLCDGVQLEVSIQPENELLAGDLSTGIPLLGAIYPTGSWLATGVRAEGKVRTPLMSYDELEEAVRAAKSSRHITGILLAPPSTDRRTGGIGLLEPYVTRLKNRTNLRIIVEVDPPADYSWLEKVYSWGADGLFIPLVPAASNSAEDKSNYQRKAVDALAFAATVFPQGAVATSLDPTVGSVETNIDLAIELQDRYILPLLYYASISDEGGTMDTLNGVILLAAALKESGRSLPDRWLNGLGHLLSPGDLISLLDGSRRNNINLEQLYKSRLGAEAVTRIGNLRRRLRVTSSGATGDQTEF